ncbi:glutathione S-transferase, partial [Neoconidiobolus thromboides FSU 785]
PIMYNTEYNKKVEETSYAHVDKALTYLDNELKGKEYLVGNQLTLADVFIFCITECLYQMFYAKEHRDKYPNFSNYFDRIAKLPQVIDVIGEFKYAQKRAEHTPKE